MTVANARCAWISLNLGGQGKNAAVFKEKMYHHKANQHNSEQVWWASAVPCIPNTIWLITRQTFVYPQRTTEFYAGVSGRFRGCKCTPLWQLVMYFSLHNCTSPSNDYAAVACSNNNQAQFQGGSVELNPVKAFSMTLMCEDWETLDSLNWLK